MTDFKEGQQIWVEWEGTEVRATFLQAGEPDEAEKVPNSVVEDGYIMRDVGHFRFAKGELEGTTNKVRYEKMRLRDPGE